MTRGGGERGGNKGPKIALVSSECASLYLWYQISGPDGYDSNARGHGFKTRWSYNMGSRLGGVTTFGVRSVCMPFRQF